MEEKNIQNDEISLLDLFAILIHYKIMIVAFTIIAMVFIFSFSLISLILPVNKSPLPNKYTSTAQMLISESSGNNMSSILNSSGLGSLAGLVGVSVPASTSNSSLAEYLVHSPYILDGLNIMFNFTSKMKIKTSPIANTRKAISSKLSCTIDENSGVFSVSFTDTDPVFAKDVVNYTVKLLDERFTDLNIDQSKITKANVEENINNTLEKINNLQQQVTDLEASVSNVYNPYTVPSVMKDSSMLKLELDAQKEIYKQLKAQEELLKVEMASETPVFQILEYGTVPDIKSGPSRGKLCIIVTFAAFFCSILLAFLLNAIKNVKHDPVAMGKLKGNK